MAFEIDLFKYRIILLHLLLLSSVVHGQTANGFGKYPNWATYGDGASFNYDSAKNVISAHHIEGEKLKDFGIYCQIVLPNVDDLTLEIEAKVNTKNGKFYFHSDMRNQANEQEWLPGGNPRSEAFLDLSTFQQFQKFTFRITDNFYYAKQVGLKVVNILLGIQGAGNFSIKNIRLISNGNEVKEGNNIDFKDADYDVTGNPLYKNSNVNSISTSISNEDLFVLGKIWGFLKYYHPALQDGSYNWDFELFKFLPIYFNSCGNKVTRDRQLIKWIKGFKLPSVATVEDPHFEAKNVKSTVDFSWIKSSLIDTALCNLLKTMINQPRVLNSYYLRSLLKDESKFYGPTNELGYPDHKFPDLGFRLLSVFRFWAYVDYLYAYKYLLDNSDKSFREFITLFVSCNDEFQYDNSIRKILAILNSGHSVLANELAINIPPQRLLKFYTDIVEDQFIVTKVDKTEKIIKPGDIIYSINGLKLRDKIESLKGLLPNPNKSIFYREALRKIWTSNDSITNVTYIRNGKKHSFTTESYITDPDDASRLIRPIDTAFQILNKNTTYLNLVSLPNNKQLIDSLFRIIKIHNNLIIDLRGSTSIEWKELRDFFFNVDTNAFLTTVNNPIFPGIFSFSNNGLKLIKRPNFSGFAGKIVVLMNEYTQSYSESIIMAFKQRKYTKILGTNSAGANGNSFIFKLPGGYQSRMESIGVYYNDKNETQQIGIKPDIYVTRTVKQILSLKDPYLEKALNILK